MVNKQKNKINYFIPINCILLFFLVHSHTDQKKIFLYKNAFDSLERYYILYENYEKILFLKKYKLEVFKKILIIMCLK